MAANATPAFDLVCCTSCARVSEPALFVRPCSSRYSNRAKAVHESAADRVRVLIGPPGDFTINIKDHQCVRVDVQTDALRVGRYRRATPAMPSPKPPGRRIDESWRASEPEI